MKYFNSILAIALLAFAFAGNAADNIYLANGGSVDGTDHAPSAFKATSDGTASLLSSGDVLTDIVPTLVVSATTYTANTIIGGKLTFTGVVRSSGNTSAIRSLTVIDNNTTPSKQPLALVLFDTPTLTGTYADATAFSINAADVSHVLRVIPVSASDFVSAGTTLAVGDPSLTSKVIDLSGTNTSCAGVLIATSGTTTTTGTATMAVKLGVRQN